MSKSAPHKFDRRVRDRNFANGALDTKAVEKYLAALPDVEAQCEAFEIDQPALELPEPEDDDVDEPEEAPAEA